jgi:geranylgeranyl diphosphate synthase type I
MSDPALMLKQLGEPLVNAAFDEFFSSNIPSQTGREILLKFREKWKDYSRPALMILSCEAVGGNPKLVEPVAKALILISGAFDIHDDIIDKSYERSEKKTKTLLGIYGYEAMLLAGDSLMMGAISYLPSMHGTISHEKIIRIAELIKNASFELGGSAFEEFGFVRNYEITPERYLQVMKMKAADVESYIKIGAIVGGANEEKIKDFGQFGRLLGMIVLLRDDIDDTFNDLQELKARILNESLPLPVLFSLLDPNLHILINSITLESPNQDLEKILELIEQQQGFEKTVNVVENYILEIYKILDKYENTEKLRSLVKTRD